MATDYKDIDSIIEENMNSGVTASDVSELKAPSEEGAKKSLLERITVTAPLGMNAVETPAPDEAALTFQMSMWLLSSTTDASKI